MTARTRFQRTDRPTTAPLPETRQKPSLGTRDFDETAVDQPQKSLGHRALEDAFHSMFELSRTTPAPTLGDRLDRLKRLLAPAASWRKPWAT
jgi:hypothetical protein